MSERSRIRDRDAGAMLRVVDDLVTRNNALTRRVEHLEKLMNEMWDLNPNNENGEMKRLEASFNDKALAQTTK